MNNEFNISDIYTVFIQGEDSSGNVDFSSPNPIPLSSINLDLSTFNKEVIHEFEAQIINIIEGSRSARNKSKPDPIAALLMNADIPEGHNPITEEDYDLFEKSRIADKWRGNRIGEVNELMAILLPGIKKSKAGELDLIVEDVNKESVAIAEVKNRFNTMNAASAINTRKNMERLVLERGSNYYGREAILVERIPKKDGEAALFNPSDPKRGNKGEKSLKIKRMGLQQFLTQYGNDKFSYIKSIVFIAQIMHENQALPSNYDMRFIFKLLKESLQN